MSGPWPYIPGVPAAGHVTSGGFWHPGRIDGCNKCETRKPKQEGPMNHNQAVREQGRCSCPCHQGRLDECVCRVPEVRR